MATTRMASLKGVGQSVGDPQAPTLPKSPKQYVCPFSQSWGWTESQTLCMLGALPPGYISGAWLFETGSCFVAPASLGSQSFRFVLPGPVITHVHKHTNVCFLKKMTLVCPSAVF